MTSGVTVVDGLVDTRHAQPPVYAVRPQPPTGVGADGVAVVRYQDLYRSGDSLAGALSRMTSPARVSFPNDAIFTLHDFTFGAGPSATGGAFSAAFQWPVQVLGALGRGCGPDGTVFALAPESSTAVGRVPTQASGVTNPLFMMVTADGRTGAQAATPTLWEGCRLRGSDQAINPDSGKPHAYHGFRLYHQAGPTVRAWVVEGHVGEANSPGGETFGIVCYRCSDVTECACEVDGRRHGCGQRVGGSCFGDNFTVGITREHCYGHDAYAGSGYTAYRCGGRFVDTLGRYEHNGAGGAVTNVAGTSLSRAGYGLNLEDDDFSDAIVDRPRIRVAGPSASGGGAHLNLMGRAAEGACDYPVTVVDPDHDPGSGPGFQVRMVNTYRGDRNVNATSPTVTKDGRVLSVVRYGAGGAATRAEIEAVDPAAAYVRTDASLLT